MLFRVGMPVWYVLSIKFCGAYAAEGADKAEPIRKTPMKQQLSLFICHIELPTLRGDNLKHHKGIENPLHNLFYNLARCFIWGRY
jgi:hypothetical protein